MRLILIVLLIDVSLGSWRVLVDDAFERTPNKNIPFTVGFQNQTSWLENNNVWFSNSPFCVFDNESSAESMVVCSTTGIIPIGYYSKQNQSYIKDIRGIVVRPTHDCFHWTIEKEQMGLGESPSVIVKNFLLNGVDKKLMLSYNNALCQWEGIAELSSNGSMAWIFVSSEKKKPDHNCFIRDSKLRLTSPKYDMSKPDGTGSMYMQIYRDNFIVKDPSSHHIEILMHNNSTSLTGFYPYKDTFNEDWHLKVIDIKMTSNFLVLLTEINLVQKWGLNGTLKSVPRDGQEWRRIFTCRIIPKELDIHSDFLVLLNMEQYNGVFYIHDLWSNSSLSKHEIPICRNVVDCYINHIEISVTLNIIRVLFISCDPLCKEFFCDYYFLEKRWAPSVEIKYQNMPISYFVFFPTNSHHMVMFSRNATYKWTGSDTIHLIAPVGMNVIKHFTVSGDVLLLQLSNDEVVYITYGQVNSHKVRLGTSGLLDIDDDVGDVFIYNIPDKRNNIKLKFASVYFENPQNQRSDFKMKEFIALNIELDALTKGMRPSIFEFKTSLKNNLYNLDKNDIIYVDVELIASSRLHHQINVIYDSNVGINVTEVHKLIKSKNHVQSITKRYAIKLENDFTLGQMEALRRTVVLFVPNNYEGYFAERLKPRSMYLSLGCPPRRRLHIATRGSEEHHDYFLDGQLADYARLQENQELQLSFYLFDGDVNLRAVHGEVRIEPVSTQKPVIVMKEKEQAEHQRTIVCKSSGYFVMHIQLESTESLCTLEARLILHVTKPKISQNNTVLISTILGFVVCLIALSISFVYFKKQTEKEHEMEAEIQQRQQELRHLVTLKHYQEHMEFQNTRMSTTSTFGEVGARRRMSLASRHTSIVNQNDVTEARNSLQTRPPVEVFVEEQQ